MDEYYDEEDDEGDVDAEAQNGNYKGIYFNDEPGQKFNDPETGAHFRHEDMLKRLEKVLKRREMIEKQCPADLAKPAAAALSKEE